MKNFIVGILIIAAIRLIVLLVQMMLYVYPRTVHRDMLLDFGKVLLLALILVLGTGILANNGYA
jgi:hypothetical protein